MKKTKSKQSPIEFGAGLVKDISYKRSANEDISSVDLSLNIVDVKRVSDKEIEIDYVYRAAYSKNTYLSIKGKLNFSNLDAKKTQKQWVDQATLPESLGSEMLSILYFVISPLAVSISTLLGLPPASLPVDFSKKA